MFFLPKSKSKTRVSALIISVQSMVEVLGNAVRQEKETKGIQFGKEEVKLSPTPLFFAD